jgi:hypothetical protein
MQRDCDPKIRRRGVARQDPSPDTPERPLTRPRLSPGPRQITPRLGPRLDPAPGEMGEDARDHRRLGTQLLSLGMHTLRTGY